MIETNSAAVSAGSGGRRRPSWRSRSPWLAVSALAASMLANALPFSPALATAGPTDVPAVEVETLDVLQLGCEGREREGVAVVACRWTVPDGAIGVRVFRLAGGPGEWRQVVHRTSNPWSNTFVDTDIRRGVRYLYVVQAVGAQGQVVAMSRPSVAGVAPLPEPTVEVLRLDCSATGDVTVRCAWTAPSTPARTLTLWRSVDGAIRERVASFAQPFPTSYGDIVPGSTSQATYAVIVTDGGGEIVARSRAQVVDFTGPSPTVTIVSVPTVPEADRVPTSGPTTTIPVPTTPATVVPASPMVVPASPVVDGATPSVTPARSTIPSTTNTPVVAHEEAPLPVAPPQPTPAPVVVDRVVSDAPVRDVPVGDVPVEVRVEAAPGPVSTTAAEPERAG